MKTKKEALKVLLLKRLSQPMKLKEPLLKRRSDVFKIRLVLLSGILLTLNNSVFAGGAATGGATEVTQIMNNVQLAEQYAQQVQQYATQLQQYQAQLQNLMLNPTSIMGSDVSRLMHGIGGVMQAGQSIGGTMAQIDGNFSRTYNSPLAGTFSQNFKTWTSASTDTLGAAMRSAGMHRDAFATDTAALTALFNKTQSSQGTVAAVQTLSEINVMQVQQMQKLQDLIATQNVATSNYMVSQNSKEVKSRGDFDAAYNHDKIMKLGGPEAEAERLKKFQ